MHSFPLLPIAIALPLLAGFVLPLLPRKRSRAADVLAIIFAAAILATAIGLFSVPSEKYTTYDVGGWAAPVGISLVLDGMSQLMLLVIAVIAFAVTVYAPRYMDQYTGKRKFYALFFLMVTGMNGVVLTSDLFNLFVFLEVASIASYALVAFGCRKDDLEASFRYLMLGTLASYLVLMAIALIYAELGTLNIAHASQKLHDLGGLQGMIGKDKNALFILSAVLFMAGLGLKAALVPFHAWLPDAHPSAPTPISAMLSGVLIKAIGVYALIRVMFSLFAVAPGVPLAHVMMVLGAVSMVFGVLMALAQWDYKRLLAYHSISQVGYIVLALGVATPLAIMAGLFHLVNHAVFKSLLFLNAGAVEYRTGTRQLEEMGGLSKRMPVTGAASLVASLSISGIPPFNGFWSKLFIIVACVAAGHWIYATLAVVVSILTLASFMKIQKYAFFGPLKEKWQRIREVPATMAASMALLSLLCVGTSVLVLGGNVSSPRETLNGEVKAGSPCDLFLKRAQMSVEPKVYRELVLPKPKRSEPQSEGPVVRLTGPDGEPAPLARHDAGEVRQ